MNFKETKIEFSPSIGQFQTYDDYKIYKKNQISVFS